MNDFAPFHQADMVQILWQGLNSQFFQIWLLIVWIKETTNENNLIAAANNLTVNANNLTANLNKLNNNVKNNFNAINGKISRINNHLGLH